MSKRSELIRALPCIACKMYGHAQPNGTEEHHLNLGGKAGQKRRGEDFSIPLCKWHHRGLAQANKTTLQMRHQFGPSLAKQSKMFRETYGSDDDLLAKTNGALLGVS